MFFTASSFQYLSPPPHHVNPVRQLPDPICFNHEGRSGGLSLTASIQHTCGVEFDGYHLCSHPNTISILTVCTEHLHIKNRPTQLNNLAELVI